MKRYVSIIIAIFLIVISAVPVMADTIEEPYWYSAEYSTAAHPFTFIYDLPESENTNFAARFGVATYGSVKSTSNVDVYSTAQKTEKIGYVGYRERVFVISYSGDKTMYYIEFKNVNTTARGYVDVSAIKVPSSQWERPITTGYVSQDFGGTNGHTGIDVAAATGTDVYAVKGVVHKSYVATGTVDNVTYLVNYGNYIKCEIGSNTVIYAHLSSFTNGTASNIESYRKEYNGSVSAPLKASWTPSAGAVIGEVGNTGWSTGSHLHFEVRNTDNSTKYDPFNYVVFPDIGY